MECAPRRARRIILRDGLRIVFCKSQPCREPNGQAKYGSAREFVETANWRRLERFALPGMAGLRIPALHGRSEELPAESSAGPESLDYWTSRMVALGG